MADTTKVATPKSHQKEDTPVYIVRGRKFTPDGKPVAPKAESTTEENKSKDDKDKADKSKDDKGKE